jgi:beta-glucanase (GH16 family)
LPAGSKTTSESALENMADSNGYQLVWADEFNKDGPPDTAAWGFEKGFVRNEEWQWYQQENAWCEGGFLIIEGRKETKPNPAYKPGSSWRTAQQNIEYTSSSINTRGRQSCTYGRFVMHGRIDISAGLWPARWTLGVLGEWPSNGKINIMEYYSGKLLATCWQTSLAVPTRLTKRNGTAIRSLLIP